MVQIDVKGAMAWVTRQTALTVGRVGAEVSFCFDRKWEGLTKTVVFRQGNVTRDVLDIDITAKIPPEVLQMAGLPVFIGVFGTNEDGTVVIPTAWAVTAPVMRGADPSGDESTNPELPVWAQLEHRVKKLEQYGGGGDVDPEEVEALVDDYLERNPQIVTVNITKNADGTYAADKARTDTMDLFNAGRTVMCKVPVTIGMVTLPVLLRCTRNFWGTLFFEGVINMTAYTVQFSFNDAVYPNIDNVITVSAVELARKEDIPEATKDGGYYTPNVTQLDENSIEVSFAPSDEAMPAVPAQRIALPSGGSNETAGGFAVQDAPPDDTSLLWVDTSDNSQDEESPDDPSNFYTKDEIDAIMGSYITDIDALIGGDS